MRKKKMTLKEKKKCTNQNICYKCKKLLIKKNAVLVCEKCGLTINLSKY